MAPATTSRSSSISTGSANATVAANDWTDFVNTVGTAVGPLLTLFGEQATKQFLSMSMGWADNILLAVGPIGIITVLISAIRIGGYRSLKAIVGRARESRAAAEQEFLSSTSEEVCELWSGREIVRVTGKPNDMKDLVIQSDKLSPRTKEPSPLVLDAAQAYGQKLLYVQPHLPEIGRVVIGDGDQMDGYVRAQYLDGKREMKPLQYRSKALAALKANKEATNAATFLDAPNITLNVRGTVLHPAELWIWTLLCAILQIATLVFPAVATYHWKWLRKGAAVPHYAYGCFLAGSVAVTIGLLGCGHVIEGSTTEYTFLPSEKGRARIQRIIRLQMDCTVGSQHFPPFAIVNDSKKKLIRVSRLNSKNYNFLSVTSGLVAVGGFVVQFIGLGALHWSATINVLGFSLLMTVIRAFVRRGLASDPSCVPIPKGIELVWLALRTLRNDWEPEARRNPRDCEWAILTGLIEPRLKDGTSICDPPKLLNHQSPNLRNLSAGTINYVRQLKRSSDQEFVLGFARTENTPLKQCPEVRAMMDLISVQSNIPLGDYFDLASKLAAVMEGIMKVLEVRSSHGEIYWKKRNGWPWKDREDWRIDVQKSLGTTTSWIVHRSGEGWSSSDLNAGISLWIYSLICGSKSLDLWYNDSELKAASGLPGFPNLTPGRRHSFIRIIGNTSSSSDKEMRRWLNLKLSTVEAYHYDILKRGLRPWPVFGLYYSALSK